MATFNRPGALPLWCENNQTNLAAPTQSLQDAGYTANEVVLAENWNFWLNLLGHWVGYLDQASGSTIMSQTLDMSTRLLEGGHWSWDATTGTLAWDAPAALTIPGATLAENSIPAGSAVLTAGQCLYVAANVPYTAPVDVTSGSTNLANVLMPSQIAVGYSVTGSGIPSNTTVTAVNDSNVTISQPATATNVQTPLTFAGTGTLTPTVATMATFTPGPATVILAVAQTSTCVIGANSGQMLLRHLESKRLLGTGGYVGTLEAPAGQALTSRQAVYLSAGSADGRTQGSLYPCEVTGTNGATRNMLAGFAVMDYASGANAHVVTSGLVGGFSGLTAGAAYYLDPNTPGGITSTRTNTAGQYIAPVGYAVTAKALLVRASAPQPVSAVFQSITVNDTSTLNTVNVSGAVTASGVVTLSNNTATANILALKPALAGATLSGFNPGGSNTWSISSDGVLSVQGISSAAGIKTDVYMGSYAAAPSSPGTVALQTTMYDNARNVVTYMPRVWAAPYAGQVLGIQIRLYSSVAFAPNINVVRNTNQVMTFLTGSNATAGSYVNYSKQYARNSVLFNMNDAIFVNLTNAPNNATLQLEADLIVELAS